MSLPVNLLAKQRICAVVCVSLLLVPAISTPGHAGTLMNQHLTQDAAVAQPEAGLEAEAAADLAASDMEADALMGVEDPDPDPLEPLNRAVFAFNETVDAILLKPAARTYVFVVPEEGRERVTLFLRNLAEPVNIANALMQGDPYNMFASFWRFILNSTFGFAGLFDFAGANTDLVYHEEDFGQTLACHGVGQGPYIVLPLLGPSTARDAVGRVVDWFLEPLTYLEESSIRYTETGVRVLDGRARALPITDDIEATSFDPYVTYRSGYLQYRDSMINNGGRRDPAHPTLCD